MVALRQRGSAFVMLQAKYVRELLMRLLACPVGLYRANQGPARRVGYVVGEVIFALAAIARLSRRRFCSIGKSFLTI